MDESNPPPPPPIKYKKRAQLHLGCVPVKFLGFFNNPNTGKVCALVHACEFQTKDEWEMNTVISERWKLEYTKVRGTGRGGEPELYEPKFRCITLDNIVKDCFCLQHVPSFCERVMKKKDQKRQNGPNNYRNPLNYCLEQRCAVSLIRPREQWGFCFT
jgi:hypothetical protein